MNQNLTHETRRRLALGLVEFPPHKNRRRRRGLVRSSMWTAAVVATVIAAVGILTNR